MMRPAAFLKTSMYSLVLSALGLGAFTAVTVEARADSISYFNTGVADDGSLLSAGVADTHYQLVSSADPGGTTTLATSANAAWVNSSTAGWISPGADGAENWDNGFYTYETTIDLTGYDPATAVLSGLVSEDNSVYIYLNGVSGSPLYSATGFSSLTPFLINSGFVSGVNRVDFVVSNDSGPTGLIVDDASLTATAETPEPGSLLLLGTGVLGGLGLLGRRSRNELWRQARATSVLERTEALG